MSNIEKTKAELGLRLIFFYLFANFRTDPFSSTSLWECPCGRTRTYGVGVTAIREQAETQSPRSNPLAPLRRAESTTERRRDSGAKASGVRRHTECRSGAVSGSVIPSVIGGQRISQTMQHLNTLISMRAALSDVHYDGRRFLYSRYTVRLRFHNCLYCPRGFNSSQLSTIPRIARPMVYKTIRVPVTPKILIMVLLLSMVGLSRRCPRPTW